MCWPGYMRDSNTMYFSSVYEWCVCGGEGRRGSGGEGEWRGEEGEGGGRMGGGRGGGGGGEEEGRGRRGGGEVKGEEEGGECVKKCMESSGCIQNV